MEASNDIVSLFPYQIKDVNNFYFRNHPVGLNPESKKFKAYWNDFARDCVEGKWVNDNGTWVFMMPKLFFYANYVKIPDKKRNIIFPNLRDNEWIIFTYYLCVEGFSGFEKDHDYTCHELVGKYEKNPDSLDEYEKSIIPKECYKEDGSFKKYVDAWTYLTTHYLIDNPAKEALGRPLYDNPIYNACVLSARGVGKSFCTFTGTFLHEFIFGGVKRFKDLSRANNRLLFGMGSGMAVQLQKSINNVKYAYTHMPGQFKFKDPNKQTYMGPFFKRVQGTWKVGAEIEHVIKERSGTIDTQGSVIHMVTLTPDRANIGAGDRFRYMLFEEFGFLSNALEVHAANKDSLASEGEKVGTAFYLGTAGDMESIKEPKTMFENPAAYDIFSIPNYWRNLNKRIGLFIPATYALSRFKDPNGNTKIEQALAYIKDKRARDIIEKDSLSYDKDVMFNPLNPDEMLRPTNSSGLPKQEAQEQINKINAYEVLQKIAQVGRLKFNPFEKSGIEWERDLQGKLRPIIDIKIDDETVNSGKDGAVIIYEQPPLNIPEGLYWVVYDPAAKSGDGESFHSVLVYKFFYTGSETSWEDTIVAEWIGRKERLDDNYMEVIKLAKYFNAKIFTESNIHGFIEWCERNNYFYLLETDAYRLEQEIHGGKAIKRSYYQVGVAMNDKKKQWALKKLRDWLLEPRGIDKKTGIPSHRTINTIYSLRILNEIVAYTGKKNENYDHISALLVLEILKGKLLELPPVNLDEETADLEENEILARHLEMMEMQSKQSVPQRAKILNY